MRFLIVTHVLHKNVGGHYYGYGPYVKEMNLWLKHVNQVVILAPLLKDVRVDPIDLAYQHKNIRFKKVPEFNLLTWGERLKSLIYIPIIFFKLLIEMLKADHIHLRCPGNMGLLGSFAQILFPWKIKSAKYAGNWDRNSIQPFTYKLQQKILSSELLTKNMQVLIYGTWPPMTKNLRSFFTATYSKDEIVPTQSRVLEEPLKLVFVGGLLPGKKPLVSCEALKSLIDLGINATLELYGEGVEREALELFIKKNNLESRIILKGNQPGFKIKEAFQRSHFLIFISESEGWPKVVAESMFWGCVPITTAVSCVPEMVGNGKRGVLVNPDAKEVITVILDFLNEPDKYLISSENAMDWSREFTLEKFEEEIQTVLNR